MIEPTQLMPQGGTLYQRVAHRVESLIHGGTLRPGEKIPSVRRLSRQVGVSVSTVLEAYRLLEDRGLVEARPQSGYYVRVPARDAPAEPARTATCLRAIPCQLGDLVLRVIGEASRPDLVPFGAAIPSVEFLPVARLNRVLARVVREHPRASQSYDSTRGFEDLRVQVARRALEAGCTLSPDEIVTTAGAQAAVVLCLQAVTKPGDTVAVESPTYYGLLEALETLHLKAFEIATDSREGMCMEALSEVLERQEIAACVVAPSHGNPLGHCMPDEQKQRMVRMCAQAGVPIIEDDVYGDLSFGLQRPRALKAFDEDGGVLLCSSFSKTLAPGYRVGWTVPGRYRLLVERLKFTSAVATATPTQMAVAAFIAGGGFDRDLRRLRRTYSNLVQRMSAAVADNFPEGTRLSRPEGGHVLWVEMPETVDSLTLHDQALEAGIGIAPGPLFSPSGRYRNCVRLNCALPWSPRVDEAVVTLGRLVKGAC